MLQVAVLTVSVCVCVCGVCVCDEYDTVMDLVLEADAYHNIYRGCDHIWGMQCCQID
jgi:hypothetical protein